MFPHCAWIQTLVVADRRLVAVSVSAGYTEGGWVVLSAPESSRVASSSGPEMEHGVGRLYHPCGRLHDATGHWLCASRHGACWLYLWTMGDGGSIDVEAGCLTR
jgi:hypothetical protein